MNLKKKVLMTLGTIGVAAAVAGGGSFATFDAQTTNPGNVFSTGTLVMSNKVPTGSACLSTAGGSTDTNANAACDTLFDLEIRKPGQSGTANLTIKNEGSISAAALKAYATGCNDADASGEAYHGTGLPCSQVQLYIQQTDSAFTANTACIYGGAAVANTCDFSDTTKTLGNFVSTYNTSGTGLSAGPLTAGSTIYLKVGVQLPSTANNSYQGRKATIAFNWFMQQA